MKKIDRAVLSFIFLMTCLNAWIMWVVIDKIDALLHVARQLLEAVS